MMALQVGVVIYREASICRTLPTPLLPRHNDDTVCVCVLHLDTRQSCPLQTRLALVRVYRRCGLGPRPDCRECAGTVRSSATLSWTSSAGGARACWIRCAPSIRVPSFVFVSSSRKDCFRRASNSSRRLCVSRHSLGNLGFVLKVWCRTSRGTSSNMSAGFCGGG